MSKTTAARPETGLRDVRVDVVKKSPPELRWDIEKRGDPRVSNRSSDYVYVNTAFVGSSHDVNAIRAPDPPTSVVREQYWTCSKWSFAQRVMAIAVGVLAGAVIGLALTIALRRGDTDVIGGLFRSHPAPD